jgi:hypothetical protein
MEEKNVAESPGKSGLQAGAEVVKYITALATGALVFSAGLLNDKVFLPTAAKWFIFFSWCLLAISIFGGLLAGMRIPIQLAKENYDLQDKYFEAPIRIQQIAFFIGILLLGTALAIILVAQGSKPDVTPSPQLAPQGPPSPQGQREPQSSRGRPGGAPGDRHVEVMPLPARPQEVQLTAPPDRPFQDHPVFISGRLSNIIQASQLQPARQFYGVFTEANPYRNGRASSVLVQPMPFVPDDVGDRCHERTALMASLHS